jgi:FkbM family methyltransferase
MPLSRSLFPTVFGTRTEKHPKLVDIVGEADWHWPKFRMKSCNALDQVACGAAAKGWTWFEAPMPHYFADAVRRAGTALVVDVGANTGFYSLLALAVSDQVTAVAYEPLESARVILAANLKLNRARKRAEVSACAVSDRSGPRDLFVPESRFGLVETSASLMASFKGGKGTRHKVPGTTLDARHGGSPRVGVLKIDAESHDLAVLHGAETVLTRDRPVVFVEVLLGADEHGLTSVLNRCGYVDCVLRPEGATEPRRVVRHDTEAWNHMWIPDENAPAILGLHT